MHSAVLVAAKGEFRMKVSQILFYKLLLAPLVLLLQICNCRLSYLTHLHLMNSLAVGKEK